MKRLVLLCGLLLTLCVHAQTLTSSNLPIIVINTNGQEILDDPKITADMGIVYNGVGIRNNITDPLNHYKGKIGIEIRGQSSQQFPMKSYSIELRKADGSSSNKSLFDLPAESDWVLYAPYNEKTLMHNFLAYTISREMGNWAANCRYVELVLNGEYVGIYVFMEKIKRKAGRVEISAMANTDVSGDELTGGYIFSIDKQADGWFSKYKAGGGDIQFTYVYPKIEKINNQQKEYIQNYTDSFENSLNSSGFQDKEKGWRKFADETSFIDFLLVNEVSRNVDGYRLSSYFHKDRNSINGKIIAGPVWDFDLAFRNADYCNGSNIEGWSYDFNSVCPGDYFQVPFWWQKLLTDTAFKSNLRCRWKQLRSATLSMDRLNYLIDSIADITAEARQRHFEKWPVLGQYVWPNPQPVATTYEGEVATLKGWLTDRLAWLDDNIPKMGRCVDYPADAKKSYLITVENPFSGTIKLQVRSKFAQTITCNLLDISARKIKEVNVPLNPGLAYYTIPANTLANGVYFLQCVNAAGERYTFKLMRL